MGEYYHDKMYEEAEKILQVKEASIRKKAKEDRDREIQALNENFNRVLKEQAEKQKHKQQKNLKNCKTNSKKPKENGKLRSRKHKRNMKMN